MLKFYDFLVLNYRACSIRSSNSQCFKQNPLEPGPEGGQINGKHFERVGWQ